MAYTLPPIAVTGEIITAAWGNDVRNALAVLKTGLTADVGSFRATLNGTAAVDSGIARPALVNSNGQDEWGMVNFGDYTALVDFTTAFYFKTAHSTWYRPDGTQGISSDTYFSIPVGGDFRPPHSGDPTVVGSGARDINYLSESDRLYVGHASTFSGVEFIFDRPAGPNRPGTLFVDYYDGSSWESLTFVDGTRATGVDDAIEGSMRQDGLISWGPPGDWAQTAVNGVTRYWVRMRWDNPSRDGFVVGGVLPMEFRTVLIEAAAATGGLGRDAEWPIIRLNDLHDTTVCPAVSAGDILSRSNSLVFTDSVSDSAGEGDAVDAYLGVLSNGNLAIAVGAAGVHALPFSIKTLNANRLA